MKIILDFLRLISGAGTAHAAEKSPVYIHPINYDRLSLELAVRRFEAKKKLII